MINKCFDLPKHHETTSPTNGAGIMGAVPGLMSGLASPLSPTGLQPQQMVIAGARKDCVRLRGLPYEAQVQHILDFLGDYSKHILMHGVHMVYNAQVSVLFIDSGSR